MWSCIKFCCVQGAPFESELEYLAYGCQGDPLVQTAVLSFQQQAALQVSPPFTQAVEDKVDQNSIHDNSDNSNIKSKEALIAWHCL